MNFKLVSLLWSDVPKVTEMLIKSINHFDSLIEVKTCTTEHITRAFTYIEHQIEATQNIALAQE